MNQRRRIIADTVQSSLAFLQEKDDAVARECEATFANDGEVIVRIDLASLPDISFLFALQGLYVVERETGWLILSPLRYEWLEDIYLQERGTGDRQASKPKWAICIDNEWVEIAEYGKAYPIARIGSDVAKAVAYVSCASSLASYSLLPCVIYALRPWRESNDMAGRCLDILSRDHYVAEEDWEQIVSSSRSWQQMSESDLCLFFLCRKNIHMNEFHSILSWPGIARKLLILEEYVPWEEIQGMVESMDQVFFLYLYDNVDALLKRIKTCLESEGIPLQFKGVWLGDSVFEGCSSLQGLHLPEPVSYDGKAIFRKCESLDTFVFPQEAKCVPERFFQQSGIKSVHLPEGMESIGANAFRDCVHLETIRIPENCRIEEGAFAGCANLSSLVFSGQEAGGVPVVIAAEAFRDCASLKEVFLPSGVEEIGAFAFAGCTRLEIVHATAIRVEESAFAGCRKLASVDGKIQSLASHAFAYCENLQDIQLDAFMEEIPDYAFQGCRSLRKIPLPRYCDTLGDHAFEDCVSLVEIDLIGTGYVGQYAFSGCASLKNVYWEEYVNIQAYAFKGCTSLCLRRDDLECLVSYSHLPKNAFDGCEQIYDVIEEYFGS